MTHMNLQYNKRRVESESIKEHTLCGQPYDSMHIYYNNNNTASQFLNSGL